MKKAFYSSNTFASPIFQCPLELDAHIVMQSMAKLINGHTDVVVGTIITNREELHEPLTHAHQLSERQDPHQARLVLCSIKILAMRIKESQGNAQSVAEYLEP